MTKAATISIATTRVACGTLDSPLAVTSPAMPISVSATGSWKQRPKATMNFMVSDRYSLIVPRNWIVTSWPLGRRGAGAELLEAEEEVVDQRQQHVEGEGAAEHEQDRRGDQERQEGAASPGGRGPGATKRQSW